jgi:alcohol dehydrogenase (NADP+)
VIQAWQGMERLVRPGQGTRYIGISNFSPEQVQDVLRIATIRPKTHQIECHPYLPQTEFIETHKRLGITVTCYSPLANTNPTYGERRDLAPQLLDNTILKEIGRDRACTEAQVALAWNLKRGVVVIPKSVSNVHQRQNIKTYNICFLTNDDMRKLEQIGVKARMNVNTCRPLGFGCFSGLEASRE